MPYVRKEKCTCKNVVCETQYGNSGYSYAELRTRPVGQPSRMSQYEMRVTDRYGLWQTDEREQKTDFLKFTTIIVHQFIANINQECL